MIRSFGPFFVLFFLITCRSAPVTLGDNRIEPVYEQVLRDSAIKARLYEIDANKQKFTIEELFVLSLDRTEQMAITAEKTFAADAKVRRSYGAAAFPCRRSSAPARRWIRVSGHVVLLFVHVFGLQRPSCLR